MQEEANLATIESIVKQQISTLETQIIDRELIAQPGSTSEESKTQQMVPIRPEMNNPNEAATEHEENDLFAMMQSSDLLMTLTSLAVGSQQNQGTIDENLSQIRSLFDSTARDEKPMNVIDDEQNLPDIGTQPQDMLEQLNHNSEINLEESKSSIFPEQNSTITWPVN